MKAEIFALAHNYRKKITIIDLTKYLGKSVGLTIVETIVNVFIH